MSESQAAGGPQTEALIKASRRITPEDTEEVRHLTLEVLDPAFQFVEGQSIGVLVPGPHPFGNAVHLRRYSIANARPMPLDEGVVIELLVRRCFYLDEVSGERYPGIASNYLCDAQPGDKITITGPYASAFRMPLDNRANLLMIGTGTGIAPFRAFAQHIYERRGDWNGQVRLFYGGRTGLDLMYANDETSDLANYYDEKTFKAFRALGTRPLMRSSEALAQGLEAHAEETLRLMREPNTQVFISGLRKTAEAFNRVMAEQAGGEEAWETLKQSLIDDQRWSELFYD
ncbi:oxidoreductase [Marichromatium gracile]|uniref:Ferredoxin--NADP+ reductase n=1 Tax=Marichromatium gracile TaxID=1048 RepID=A0A4R4A4U2_MARGR|nr:MULTISPECIES: oxidoreductase [Marichromatium]MBO8085321.1 oxidoreductase [Marichromatium sp.]KXX65648.1 oxidoreductase [Marichromatium gracile]MBK1709492.1 oxidoreductase [Marichromatium gracile]MCF1184706.1 oxidoreductase [Marichromatium gracile]RNE88872.1 oxidoreductase [Marichromatium sp. AB31]